MKTTAGGALSALLATFAVAFAPDAVATPPLPPSPAITPGAGIVVADPSGSAGGTCTAGWLAHDRDGQSVMLSAGHCDHHGLVSMKWSATGRYEPVGTFEESTYEGAADADGDFGVVKLNSQIPLDTRVLDRRPVDGVARSVQIGDVLCKYGNTTQRQCGPVVALSPSTVTFTAESQEGDSGGPVYFVSSRGGAVVVGITRGHDDAGAVAELAQPWLDKFGLTIDTTVAAGAQRAGFGR